MLSIYRTIYRFSADRPLKLNRDVPSIGLRGVFCYAMLGLLSKAHALCSDRKQLETAQRLFVPILKYEQNGIPHISPPPYVIRGNFAAEDSGDFMMENILFAEAVELKRIIDIAVALMSQRSIADEEAKDILLMEADKKLGGQS